MMTLSVTTLQVFWTITILMMAGMTSGIVDVPDYFEEGEDAWDGDAASVTWAHGVNTREALMEALNGEVMMIEADVMMGRKEGSSGRVPVMAHPPITVTDLSLDDFLDEIIKAHKDGNKSKGIKLDFKQLEAAEVGLKTLERLEKNNDLDFPVWINADILQGPVNCTKPPVDAEKFLNLVHKHLPKSTLSIGWVTRYGRDEIKRDPSNRALRTITDGEYSKENIGQMLTLIESMPHEWDNPISFPVRAGLAARSEGIILHLINGLIDHESSITLWSADDDPVDLIKLRQLINALGKSRVFIDLPFDLKNGPIIIPDPKLEQLKSRSPVCLSPSILLILIAVIKSLFSKY